MLYYPTINGPLNPFQTHLLYSILDLSFNCGHVDVEKWIVLWERERNCVVLDEIVIVNMKAS